MHADPQACPPVFLIMICYWSWNGGWSGYEWILNFEGTTNDKMCKGLFRRRKKKLL